MAVAATRRPTRSTALAMVASGGVLFGLNNALSRVLIDGPLGPSDLALSRITALAASLGAWALLRHAHELPRGRALLEIGLFGVLGIAALQWCVTQAVARVDVGIVLTFVFSASFPTAVFSRVVWRERQPATVWMAMAVASVGLVLAVGVGGAALAGTDPVGILFAIATSLLFAYYSLHGSRLLRRYPMAVALGLGSLAALLVWGTTVAPIWQFPFGAMAGDISLGGRLAGVMVPGLIVLAVSLGPGTILPYVLYLVGMSRVGPTLGVLTGTMEPIVAAIAAWIWIDQTLEPLQVVGCLLVIGAVVLVQLTRPPAPGEAAP